jgi:hypothetical protein
VTSTVPDGEGTELRAEIARLRRECAIWETAALTSMSVAGLDPVSDARVWDRIFEIHHGWERSTA